MVRQRLGMVYGCLDEGMNVYEWWKDGLKAAPKKLVFVNDGRLCVKVIRVE